MAHACELSTLLLTCTCVAVRQMHVWCTDFGKFVWLLSFTDVSAVLQVGAYPLPK